MNIITTSGFHYSSLNNRICIIVNKEDKIQLEKYFNIQEDKLKFQSSFFNDLQVKINDCWFDSNDINSVELRKDDIQQICNMPDILKHYAIFPESFSLVSNYDLVKWVRT